MTGALEACRPFLARALASPKAWRRLRAAGDRLPAALGGSFHLECHLSGRGARVDLIVGVDEPGRELLRGDNPALSLPDELRRAPVWRRLGELCASWHRQPELRSQLHGLWLELDLPAGGGRRVPEPLIFLDVLRPPASSTESERRCRFLAELCERFVGAPAPPALAAGVAACWSLGGRDYLHSVGLAPATSRPGYRLCLRCDDRAGLRSILASLGLAATYERFRRQTRTAVLPPTPPPTLLDLDLDEHGSPGFGVEWQLPASARGEPSRRALALLGRLEERGVLPARTLAALCRWPGAAIERVSHELWPSVVQRRINHLKLIAGADGSTEAKVYLRCERRPYRRPE